ncbi:MAG: 2-hydroxychromene-2-carboxylate isomerase, partial [Arenicella sp.]
MDLEALISDSPVIVYIDIKSPYAYLAVQPTRELEHELGLKFDWRPFVLDIPSYLGSASLDKSGNVAEQNRSAEQWAGVKYAYADCRRYASLSNMTIRGTVKIWDTNLISTAMLWAKQHNHQVLDKFIDLVYQPFWKRQLDIDDISIIEDLLDNAGADGSKFSNWANREGFAINQKLQDDAFDAGIYGVPTYIVNDQMYFGREHLPRVRWQLGDQSKPAPDMAYTLPDESLMEHPTRRGNPQQITIGIENTLDCLLAIAALKTLLDQYNLTAQWVAIQSKDFFPAPSKLTRSKKGQSRAARHTQFRAQNHQADLQRYARANVTSSAMAEAVRAELQRLEITLTDQSPPDVTHPALPGIVVKIDENLFIGRQHL